VRGRRPVLVGELRGDGGDGGEVAGAAEDGGDGGDGGDVTGAVEALGACNIRFQCL